MEIGRPFNFLGLRDLLEESVEGFGRAADGGVAIADQQRALQEFRVGCDGLEQGFVGGIGQVELGVLVFVFAHEGAQRCAQLAGELLQVGQRGWGVQIFDDFEWLAGLLGEGLGLFKRGAGFGAAGVVVDLHLDEMAGLLRVLPS